LIDKLKGLGEQIKQLEFQKLAAVEAEDFDAAKICKVSDIISDPLSLFLRGARTSKCRDLC
jgi:hypothetical protein